MKARRATVKSFASLKAWLLLCLVMLCAAGVKAQTPYAIWCEDNTTLYFTNSNETYAAGGTYDGQSITTVWSGTEVTNHTSGVSSPWASSLYLSVKKVVFDESFKAVKPQTLSGWFYHASNLTTIEGLENLDTSEATSMANMFNGCSSLTTLDLRNFKLNFNITLQPTFINSMFEGCTSLTTIYCNDNWNDEIIIYNENHSGSDRIEAIDVFKDCDSLVGGNGAPYSYFQDGSASYACVDTDMRHGYFTQIEVHAIWCEGNSTLYFTNRPGWYGQGGKFYGQTITKVWSGDEVTNYSSDSFISPWMSDINQSVEKVVFDETFKTVKPLALHGWLYDAPNLSTIEGLEYLDTSEATSMANMFYNCNSLTSIDVSHFNTSNVTDMRNMFYDCSSLTSIDVSHFNTSNVTDIQRMFYNCSSLTSIDVSNFDVSKVASIEYMFYNCSSLTSLDLTNFKPNFDITLETTFFNSLFEGCSSLKTIYCNDNWYNEIDRYNENHSGSDRIEANNVFKGCTSLIGGNGTSYLHYNDPIYLFFACVDDDLHRGYFTQKKAHAIWCEENSTLYFTNSPGVFTQGDKFNGHTITNVWSGEEVTNYYSEEYPIYAPWASMIMSSCKTVFIDGTFKSVKPKTLRGYFLNASDLTTIEGLEYLDTSEATSMTSMFDNCNSLTSIDVSHFNTSNVTDMGNMFYDCSSLTSIDVSHFNTSNVTDMRNMFNDCSSLTSIDVSNFDVSKVASMEYMFYNCSSLTTLDLRNFKLNFDNTLQPDFISHLFEGCSSLTTIYCDEDWDDSILTYNENLSDSESSNRIEAINVFEGCTSLVGGNNTSFDGTKINNEYARPDLTGLPGYFTSDRIDEIKPYAIWCADNRTLTFVYSAKTYKAGGFYEDTKITKIWSEDAVTNTGDSQPQWIIDELKDQSTGCSKVVFHESFQEVRPKSLNHWFFNMKNLTKIEGLEYLNTGEATDMSSMFSNCSFLTAIDVSLFDTRNVTTMNGMFANTSLQEIDLRSFDVSKVSDVSGMFQNCDQLTTIYCDVDWSSVTSTSFMFENCQSLVGGNQTAFESSHKDGSYARPDVEGTPGYFTVDVEKIYVIWCEDNATLYFTYGDNRCIKNGIHEGHTVTKYWTEDFEGSLYVDNNPQEALPMWSNYGDGENLSTLCQSVVFEPSFSNARPTSLRGWFYWFEQLTSIEGLDNLNTSEVTNMSLMFANCSKLTSLDVNSFNTSKVTIIDGMFSGCSNLTTIYCNNDWSQGLIDGSVSLFGRCESLVGGNGKTFYEYDRNKEKLIYARPDSEEKPGYFTSAFKYNISSAGAGTLYMDYAVKIPEADNFEVYYISSIDSEGTLHLTEIKDVIPANTGVIIFGNEGSYLLTKYSGEVDAIDGNQLQGVAETTSMASLKAQHGTDIYVLSRGKDSNINFLKAGSGMKTIPANRAYLPYSNASGAKELTIVFDEATGIGNVTTEKAERTGVYNMAGQRVAKPQHGIYIVNGKKILIP